MAQAIGWARFRAVLAGEIPDRVPLVHIWGDHPGFMNAWIQAAGYTGSDEERLLWYRRDAGFPIGLQVGWWSKLPRGYADAGGIQRYTQGGLPAGSSLRQFEHIGDLDLLRAQCRHAVAASHRFGLACRGNLTNCFHALAVAMGLEQFALAIYEQPDWLEEAMEQAERYNRRGLEVMLDEGVDFILFDGDCAYKTSTMISPEQMRRFWFERTRQTIRLAGEAGAWTCYHTDGRVDDVLPMLIEMGVDCFHGCEKAANDLEHLKRSFGDRITLIGNADHSELTFGTPEMIVAETEGMIRTAAPGGRYAADINTQVPQEAPLENYRSFYDTVMRVGTYAADGALAAPCRAIDGEPTVP